MAIFLVDLEFREKAKSLLTSRELAACVFLLLLALLPWAEVIVSACTIYIYTSLLSLHLVIRSLAVHVGPWWGFCIFVAHSGPCLIDLVKGRCHCALAMAAVKALKLVHCVSYFSPEPMYLLSPLISWKLRKRASFTFLTFNQKNITDLRKFNLNRFKWFFKNVKFIVWSHSV